MNPESGCLLNYVLEEAHVFWEMTGLFHHGQLEFLIAKPRIFWSHNWIVAFAGLLLLLEGTAQHCPPICQVCSADRVECEQISSLQAVLIGLPNGTEEILLRYGNLSEIPPLSFQNFPNLHNLSINGFLVSSLSDLTFSTAQVNSLRSLDLSNNHLLSCSIEPMAFSGLVSLEELVLDNNYLDILQNLWFLELPALSKLSLALNRISYLPPRTFENLTRLEELIISSNQIQYLSMDTFYGLASLALLDLSNNKILFIHSEVFRPLQTLRHLQLAENRLTALPALPNSITFLFLHANPWDCSCQLVASVESWGDRIQESAQVVCNMPPSLTGFQVTKARLEGCSFFSQSNHPPQTIWNLGVLYGFLGGVLFALMVCLILGCCLKHCKCPSRKSQTETKNNFISVFSREAMASAADPQILGSFPVTEDAMIGFKAAKGPHDPLRETSKTCNMEQLRSRLDRPLVAVLLVDQVTNTTVVTLCDKGSETRGSNQNQSLWQTKEEQFHSANQMPWCLGDTGEQGFVCSERKFCGPAFQHATSDQMDNTEYVFPVVGWRVDNRLGGQLSSLERPQPPRDWIHGDLPAGNATKTQRSGDVSWATSSQRNESPGSGHHLNVSHGQSEMEGKLASPGHCSPSSVVSPNRAEAPEMSCWQGHFMERRERELSMERRAQGGFMDRRHLESRARRRESSRKAAMDSKDHCLRLSKSSRKLLQNLRRDSDYRVTPASSLSSSSSSRSISPQPRKRARFSRHLSAAPQTRKKSLENKTPGRQQAEPDVAKVKRVEKFWECQICGRAETQSRSVPQKSALGQLADGFMSSSRWLLDIASQPPFSSDAPPRKDGETAHGPPENAETLLAEDLVGSNPLPDPQPPFGISHPGPNENEEEAIYEYPQPLCAKSPPGRELPHQVPGVDFPQVEKTVTQTILKDQSGLGIVHTTTEMGSMTVHSIKGSTNVRSLGEEMYNAQVEVEALAHTFDEYLAGQEKAQADTAADKTQLPVDQVDRSSKETSFPGDEEPQLWKVTTVTSTYPLVQRMFQIDFPLPDEE